MYELPLLFLNVVEWGITDMTNLWAKKLVAIPSGSEGKLTALGDQP